MLLAHGFQNNADTKCNAYLEAEKREDITDNLVTPEGKGRINVGLIVPGLLTSRILHI